MKKGEISVKAENILPVIKKWLYSDKDIFLRVPDYRIFK